MWEWSRPYRAHIGLIRNVLWFVIGAWFVLLIENGPSESENVLVIVTNAWTLVSLVVLTILISDDRLLPPIESNYGLCEDCPLLPCWAVQFGPLIISIINFSVACNQGNCHRYSTPLGVIAILLVYFWFTLAALWLGIQLKSCRASSTSSVSSPPSSHTTIPEPHPIPTAINCKQ